MRLTLEKPNACRFALICPVFIPIVIVFFTYISFPCTGIIVYGVSANIMFALFYLINISTYLLGISTITYCAKKNFKVKKGEKVYKQNFYEKQYHMTLLEYIRSEKNMIKDYTRDLRKLYKEMEDDSFQIVKDAIYYKSGNKLLEIIYEEDESKSSLLHLDRETATWSYNSHKNIDNNIVVTKAQMKELFNKLEIYLKDNNYKFNYHVM